MAYGWDRHHTMNHMAKGENAAKVWKENFVKDTTRYASDDVLMTFVTNHDENSWNGTIKERLGESWEAMTVLSYLAPGMPLIYSGQEFGLKHRLKFFEKDSIPHTKGKEWKVLQKLAKLKGSNLALNGGKNAATYETLETGNKNIVAFKRSKNNNEVVFIANFSKKKASFSLSEKEVVYVDYMTSNNLKLNSIKDLASYEYRILIKK
jgi:1,4-alpha-glucan branching enzyme